MLDYCKEHVRKHYESQKHRVICARQNISVDATSGEPWQTSPVPLIIDSFMIVMYDDAKSPGGPQDEEEAAATTE